MIFNFGDQVEIKPPIYVDSNAIYSIGKIVSIDTPFNEIKVRLENYPFYRSDTDYHWINKKRLYLLNSNNYKCPICKENRCSTINCG